MKNKYAHTSGPWSLFGKYEGELSTIITKGRISIADVIGCDANEGDITPSEAIANAKLIAAAPDLLSVLLTIKELIDIDEERAIYDNNQEYAGHLRWLRERIEPVIQKATE